MDEAEQSDLLGRTVGGTYRIEERLGAGGMGEVYRATHMRTGRPYAVKVLLPEMAVRRDAMKRFRREADAVGALGHANVVAIHDFDVSDGLAYLVMDLLDGEDLAERLKAGPLSLPDAVAIIDGICAGLGAAHARGMLHRDLKPANVFLARQPGAPERAVLLDFGLAKSLARSEELSALTASGVVMGTPQYMSPEQASGLPLDARADLYAVATIFYEMLAGRTPFDAPTLPALFAQLATAPPPPIEMHRTDLPPALSSVLNRALAKSADDRYPDAEQLVNALRSAARGAAIATPGALPPTVAAEPSATPIGNPAASWPRGIDPMAPTQATPSGVGAHGTPAPASSPTATQPKRAGGLGWLLLAGAVLAFGGIGIAGGLYLYWLQIQDTREQLAEIQRSVPRPPDPVEIQRAIAEAAAQQEQSPAFDAPPEATRVEPVPVEGDEVTAQPTRRRRRRVERNEAPRETPPAAPPTPPPSAGSYPPGMPRDGAVQAIEYMERGDYAGCVRETHRHPRSTRILSTRMNCARMAHDHAELRGACAELRQHYPQSPHNNACDAVMLSEGVSR